MCSRRKRRWIRRWPTNSRAKPTWNWRASRPALGQLVAAGVVSQQENDQYQAQYQAQLAGVQSLEKAIAAAAQQHRRGRSEPGAPGTKCRATGS